MRADEIYDNRPIIQDIQNSIHNAKVILADVTGRNPNVNYELGAAHALNKEVIILTANSKMYRQIIAISGILNTIDTISIGIKNFLMPLKRLYIRC